MSKLVASLIVAGLAAAVGAGGPRAEPVQELEPPSGRIAVVSRSAYGTFLAIRDLAGTRSTPLTAPPGRTNRRRDLFPKWSPDGSSVAFGRSRRGSWGHYVARLGGGVRRVAAFSGFVWSPDSRQLVGGLPAPCVGQRPDAAALLVAPARGGTVRRLQALPPQERPTATRSAHVSVRDWSRRGELLYVVATTNPGDGCREHHAVRSLWRMRANGTGRRVVARRREIGDAAWSPNGRSIAFVVGRAGDFGCDVLVKTGGEAPRRLRSVAFDPAGCYGDSLSGTSIEWSADGREVFVGDGRNLLAVDVRTRAARFVLRGEAGQECSSVYACSMRVAAVSPDGAYVVAEQRAVPDQRVPGALWVIGRGGERWALPYPAGAELWGETFDVRVSPAR